MGNADFCSRFPLEQLVPEKLDLNVINSINFRSELPIDQTSVAKATSNDEFLQKVIFYMKNGWPKKVAREFADVYSNQHELEVMDGCLLYQHRVVIPHSLKSKVLKLLHSNHLGIVKMKQIARQTVYWFGINMDIERYVSQCWICDSMATVPKQKIESQWTPTNRPFSRIHIDFFYFEHCTFLLVVDSYTKWLEIEYMKNGTDTTKVLRKLVQYFARYGLPDVVVSDNGPPFNSVKFCDFLKRQGIVVLKSPPYHPPSNGQAERLVRTVKEVLKKFLYDPEYFNMELEDQIQLFLSNYRNYYLTSDGRIPSHKVFNFKPKTMIDLLNPRCNYKKQLSPINDDLPGSPKSSMAGNKEKFPDGLNDLSVGDFVWYRNNNPNVPKKWIEATFLKRVSTNVFQVQVGSAAIMAHRDQLRKSKSVVPATTRNTVITFPNTSSVTNDDSGEHPFSVEPVEVPEMRELIISIPRLEMSDQRIHPLAVQDRSSKFRRKRKLEETPVETNFTRRSKRKKSAKSDSEYLYY